MKIERINENQIRCTLSNFDLSVRNLNMSELAYGSEKARNLFREMIQRASNEVGFDAEDIPLMVEAIPLANDSIMLIMTKIEDPEELDTRFSKFSPVDEDEDNSWSSLTSELLEGADNLLKLWAEADKTAEAMPQELMPEKNAKTPSGDESQYMRTFMFDSLDLVCEAAKETGDVFAGSSVLYKNPSNQKFYLVLRKEGTDDLSFSRTCNLLAEYGTRLKGDAASEAYYKEHYDIIVKKDALKTLSSL